jgi:hypothetical protein
VGSRVRYIVVSFDDEIDAHEKLWIEQCVEAENEFFAFAVGFLISIVARRALTGCTAQLHWMPIDTGDAVQTWGLLGFAALFGCFVSVGTGIRHFTDDHDWIAQTITIGSWHWEQHHTSYLERASAMFELTMAMSCGWCLLFWGYWLFWNLTDGEGVVGDGSVVVARVVMVLFFTVSSFLVLIVLDYIADRSLKLEAGLRALSEAFVLVVGLSWESASMDVFTAVNEYEVGTFEAACVQIGQTVIICMFVLPAWILYILPHALHHSSHGHGPSLHLGGALESDVEQNVGVAGRSRQLGDCGLDADSVVKSCTDDASWDPKLFLATQTSATVGYQTG